MRIEEHRTDHDADHQHRVLLHVAEVLRERARNGEEEVEVHERPGDGEEDLLHEVGGDRARERARRG
jgi:hypothetical protein